jgi:hypothetical protein
LNEFRILFSYEHTALVYALRPDSRAARPRHWRGLFDVRAVVKPFSYALDPLCVGACALYAVNRFLIKPHVGPGFFHSHFNDALLIPAALPLMLWVYRRLGWRKGDAAPSWREVAAHTVLWAVICEGIGPRMMPRYGVADWLDVIAYLVGAVVAWVFWNRAAVSGGKRAMRTAP